MRIERDFGECFEYSLHDANVWNIEYSDGNLILHFDHIFYYNEDGAEDIHKAKVIFEKVDIDGVEILLFDNTINRRFSGTSIDLKEYQDKHKQSEFEVLVETYNRFRAVLQGWLWTDGVPVDCIINIFYLGKMIYEFEES